MDIPELLLEAVMFASIGITFASGAIGCMAGKKRMNLFIGITITTAMLAIFLFGVRFLITEIIPR